VESSDSEIDIYLSSTQPKHYLKPPKYNGTTTFETFYAQFSNCATFNRWDRSEQLAHLKAALTEETGQVLWDCGSEVTGSLSKLVKILKERFGGAALSEKYRMELRSRIRQPNESLQVLHRDIRRLIVLAHPEMDAKARETIGVDYFLDSLCNPDWKWEIRRRHPSSLDEALKEVLLLEVWEKDSFGAKNRPEDKGKPRTTRAVGSEDKALEINSTLRRMEELMKKQSTQPTYSSSSSSPGAISYSSPGLAVQSHRPLEQPTISPEIQQVSKDSPVQPVTQSKQFQSNQNKSGRRPPPVCWNCGRSGHLQFDCRLPPNSDKLRSTPVRHYDKSISRPSNVYLNATIKGRAIGCLLDTGSDITLVPYEVVQKHKCKLQRSALESVKAANGTDIIIDGETVLPLHIAGHQVRTEALVSRDLTETILGIDWLRDHDCEWNFVEGKVRFNKGDWIELVGRYSEGCRRVYVSEDVLLKPREQTMVPARATLNSLQFKPSVTTVEAQKLRPGIYIGRTLIPSDIDKAKVCIVNTLQKPQLLTKGTCLGNLQVANLVEEATTEEKKEEDSESVLPKLMGKLPDELDQEERCAIRSLLQKYEDIFSKNEFDIGRTHLVEYHIDTGDHRPIRQPLRRQPLKHLDAIDDNVQEMLKHGIIEPAASPWVSNVVIVAKKDGSLRFCVDYRAINSVTYKDSYPLPLIDNCLNAMNGSSWFSTLDLRAGYHNIPVAEKDRDKTAFVTRRGCWRFTVMPFGMTCAPSVFQRLMDLVLCGLSYEFCLVYLDDIVIYSSSFEEHLVRLELVFERLRYARLKLKPSKCSLFQRKVAFLGHTISESGVAMQEEKIEAVKKWPVPKNLHDVRSFIGLCSYYRRFIAGFADIAAPLHALAGKDVKFQWKIEHQLAFEQLKLKLTSAPVLAMPSNDGHYILDTDASDIGLGAVLSQVQDGEERVIAFASRTLQKPEKNYETTRKELLAVTYGLKQFRQYLLGRPITIRVDHAALTWLRRTAEPLPQLARWLTLIEQYDYTVVHRSGKKHQNADSLSRRREEDKFEAEGPHSSFAIKSAIVSDIGDLLAGENIITAQLEDEEIGPIVRWKLEKEEQPPIGELLAMSEPTKILWSQWDRLTVRQGIIYRQYFGKSGKSDSLQLLVPASLRSEAIKRCHTGMAGGHMGTKKTIDQVQRRFYWVKWRGDTARYCRQCLECCSYHRGKLA